MELKPVRPIIDSPIYQIMHNQVWNTIPSVIGGTDETALQDAAILIGSSIVFPSSAKEEEDTNSSDSEINIGVNIPKPPIYGDLESGFSLVSDDVFDINKPFHSTWINNVKQNEIENKN